jgi:hypothetical protein
MQMSDKSLEALEWLDQLMKHIRNSPPDLQGSGVTELGLKNGYALYRHVAKLHINFNDHPILKTIVSVLEDALEPVDVALEAFRNITVHVEDMDDEFFANADIVEKAIKCSLLGARKQEG